MPLPRSQSTAPVRARWEPAGQREARRLRRFGYRTRWQPDPLIGRLDRAGLRPTPLNRDRPGHLYARCPRCQHPAGLWVEPDRTWVTGVAA